MLYHLFQYLESFDFPGAGVFQYITFRSACAIILSLIIASVVGKRVIRMLQRQQIGEEIRDLGLQGQMEKKGTPTMGGIIILLAILIPVLLFARLDNVYIQLMIISTIWLGLIGFADDYIKVFRKHKEGLKGRFKVIGQVGLGLIVGLTLYMNDEVVIRERAAVSEIGVVTSTVDEGFLPRVPSRSVRKISNRQKQLFLFLKITSSIMPGLLLLRENMPTSWGGCCLFWLLFLSLQLCRMGRI